MKKTILVGLMLACGMLSGAAFAQNKQAKVQPVKQGAVVVPTTGQEGKVLGEKGVIKIDLAHVVKENSPKGNAAIRFKEILETKFPGRVSVALYHDNKLYKDREELGVVNVLVPTTGKVAGAYAVPEFQIFDVPFLFSSFDDVSYYMKSKTAEKLLDTFNTKAKGIKALSFWPLDFRNYHGPVPFKGPEDFKNYSFRAESGGLIKRATETFGAKEVAVLSFADLPAALKKEGEVKLDAAETPFSNFWGAKLYESQPWMTLTNHNFQSYVLLVNSRWLNALPPDIKEGVIEASKEAGDFHIKQAIEEREHLKKQLEAKGTKFYELTPEEREKFKKASVPVHQFFMDKINKELLLESYETIKSRKK